MSDLTNNELNEVTGGAARGRAPIAAPKKDVKPGNKQPQKQPQRKAPTPTPAPKKNNQPKTPDMLEEPGKLNKKR